MKHMQRLGFASRQQKQKQTDNAITTNSSRELNQQTQQEEGQKQDKTRTLGQQITSKHVAFFQFSINININIKMQRTRPIISFLRALYGVLYKRQGPGVTGRRKPENERQEKTRQTTTQVYIWKDRNLKMQTQYSDPTTYT